MFIQGLAPIVSQDPKVLILGSMPGEKSLRLQQYYANPGNCFWYILGEICGANPEFPYTERTTRLTQVGIALWDVLKNCEREGSLDNRIVKDTEVPNNFDEFLRYHQTIEIICFNGQKAQKLFVKLVVPAISGGQSCKIPTITLPSTSPANAAKTKTEKTDAWVQMIRPHLSILNV